MLANRPYLFLHGHHKLVILKSQSRCCALCRFKKLLDVNIYDLSLEWEVILRFEDFHARCRFCWTKTLS